MKIYKVKYGQNLFDVAVTLYGSVEGIYALMIANQDLCISSELEEGDELMYQEGWSINLSIVQFFSDKKTYPANGECKVVVPDEWNETPFLMAVMVGECPRFYMEIIGSGTLEVDWGDGKNKTSFRLSSTPTSVSHWYPEVSEQRVIRFFGNPGIKEMKIKTGEGELRLLRSLSLKKYENLSKLKDSQARNLITIN